MVNSGLAGTATRPIRVLRVIARLNMGGPAKHVGILSGRRMETRGYETLLVHGSLAPGEESLQEYAESEGAELVFLPELVQPIKPHSDQRAFRELAKLVRRFKPDVVHTHTAKGGFVGRSAALTLQAAAGDRSHLPRARTRGLFRPRQDQPSTAVWSGLPVAYRTGSSESARPLSTT